MDAKIVAAVLLIVLLLFTPMPLINSINPDHGLNIGTVDVVISGAKFDNKATIKLSKPGEPDIVATNVKVISKKQISCSFDLLGQTAGKWNVIVANKNEFTKKDKTASLAEAFTIQYPAPTISTIEPNRGLNSKIVTARLTGNWFRTGAKVILNKGNQNIAAISITVNAPTQIDSQFNLKNAEPGMYDVQVINDDEQMGILEKGFLIGTPAPEVTAIKPNQGIIAEKITALVTGNNFRTGAKVALDNGQQVIEASEIKVLSATEISSKLDLTGFSPGIYNVTVTNDDGQSGSLAGGFTIEYPAPTVTGIEPNQGLNSETVTANICGTNFRAGAAVELLTGDQSIGATDVQVISDSQITAVFNLAGSVPQAYDVKVTNDDGQSGSLAGGFTIEYPAPTVTGIEPNQGLNSETVTANISGTNFRAGAAVELLTGDQSIGATDVQVISDSQITAVFNLAGSVPQAYDVKVTNDDGKSGSLAGGFTIEYPAPTVTGIEPNQGLNSETVTTNISGTNFRAGAAVELLTGDQSIGATDVQVISDSQITAVFDLAGSVPQAYDVKVTNDDGKSGSLAGGFVVNILKPAINAINPAEGFNNGALLTEITGDNFAPGALVKLVGSTAVEIPGLNIDIKNSGQITCFFDLTQKPVGSYDVMVINPNGQSAVLPNGFKVKVYIPNNQELNDLLKPVFFDFDRFALRTDQIPILDADVKILTQHSKLYILLGGHADERGTREYNLELSKKRAEAIRDFLVAKGIDSTNIVIYAYGKDYPVKKGHDESSWWYNRRVDIIVWESPPTREQGLIKIIGTDGENN